MSLAVHTADLDVIGSGFVHLDYAATAPCVRAAADAVNGLLPSYGSVHRGTGPRSQTSTLEYERSRAVIADFLGCRPGDQVVFTRNTTDALNLLARSLPAGTTTVVFDGEHHANLLPWPNPVRLPAPASPEEAIAAAGQALAGLRGPVLLAVTGASNVTGEVWPVHELAEVAHAHGARIVVDAAQLAPHRPIDLREIGADYVALSGHKLYAPFGAGVLAGRADWLDAAPPYLAGGGASAAVGDTIGDVRWQTGPARHEGGTPNLLGAVSLAAVCSALAESDRGELHEREQQLLAQLRDGLGDVPGADEVSIFGPWSERVGIVAIAVPGHDPAAVATRLADDFGIGVRAGLFCAHPLVRRLTGATGNGGCEGGLLRVSFGLGTTPADIDALLAALRALLR
ncbi:aminotransferase class V-fold PLP-dependent enzyme [Paractinoplanes durhamensis]|uniref:Cysteine desulfurase n=1 Tax=Paractinoplanes durhamensis TaxID=113563 RepID=A0ABQ3YVZ6_9ACTN|nr:aminotransferase class V-fold PLP-dependent enzyme [Actinoplanes durhamensis]GIE01674.1 cysteine desulfurase [Actinoplanes durhamensis]